MDNLPKDPPDDNKTPPSFGSSFDPHSNPVDPNNPYSSQPLPTPQNPVPNFPDPPNTPNPPNSPDHPSYSEIAQHKLRDSHGRFATDHIPSDPSSSIQTTPNIVKRIFDFLIKIKWKKMTLYITGAATFIYLIISNPAFQNLVNHYFPNSSPILGRAVSLQGVLKSSQSGIYSLVLPNQETYTLHFKPTTSLTNLKKLNEVVVKGNLTWTPYVIENAEIYPLNFVAEDFSPTPRSLGEVGSNPSSPPNSPNPPNLPKLYSSLTWEITQSKTLLFTSGKRRIEQEGVYLESAQVTDLPQAFLDYYTTQLTNTGFKQTLNSSDPNGTTVTYSKDDLFMTFGVKNIYSGSGDSKKIVGYKAFIEHN